MPPEFVERRQDPNNKAVTQLMQEVTDQLKHLRSEVAEIKRRDVFGSAITTEMIEKAVDKAVHSGFPDGDLEAHRQAHLLYIKREQEKAEFWSSMRKEVGKWGLISVIGFLFIAAWQAFLQGPHK